MKVTEVRVNKYTAGKLRGFADVTFDDTLVVKGFKIWDGKNGLFVAPPSMKGKDGEYRDSIWLKDDDIKDAVRDNVLTQYHGTGDSTSQDDGSHKRNVRASLKGAPGDLPDPPF